ncbi:hypothetical protein CANINC_000302 [Pichia inconspicua]|uniref:Uncharacterized protein n=1 Tax=Pichia inconspicua TaxID=52247 RepID=A0A4T0X6E0_9ASCO|nr:hypothetical protein CANINC_000302 [[Candida] inconspicua]
MMLHSETNETTLGTSSMSDLDSSPFPYCKRKIRKYCSYDNKYYDDFNSTILYPTESVLGLQDPNSSSINRLPCENLTNLRGVKRSNNTHSSQNLPLTTNASKLDMIIRRDENRSTYELSKQAAIIHESILSTINEFVADSDTDYDADYDNDDFKKLYDPYHKKSNENIIASIERYDPTVSSIVGRNGPNDLLNVSDERIQWELQQLEEMEEMEDIETLDIVEQFKGMNL